MKSVIADRETRTLCLRIVPQVGSAIRITHHPRNLTMGNGQVYLAGSGYEFTGYTATAGLPPSMVDLQGILDQAGIGRDEITSGLFDNARCYLFATSWITPVEDQEPLAASILGKAELTDDRYRIEEMALVDALNQVVGNTYTTTCQKVFGGQEYAGCKVALGPLTVTGTITQAVSALLLRDTARAEAAGYFTYGKIWFTSGANTGLPAREIKEHLTGGDFSLYEPFYYPVQIGDAYSMTPGCGKGLDACKAWSNIENFGGFSHIPTSSIYMTGGL